MMWQKEILDVLNKYDEINNKYTIELISMKQKNDLVVFEFECNKFVSLVTLDLVRDNICVSSKIIGHMYPIYESIRGKILTDLASELSQVLVDISKIIVLKSCTPIIKEIESIHSTKNIIFMSGSEVSYDSVDDILEIRRLNSANVYESICKIIGDDVKLNKYWFTTSLIYQAILNVEELKDIALKMKKLI